MKALPFYYGWVIVGLSFVVVLASYGLLFSYAVFVPSFAETLGLEAAAVSAPFSICVATYAILGLVTGRMTDRWGPRPVILAGAAFLAAGYVVLSQATELWHLFFGMSVLVGIGMSTPYIPTSVTIVRWFVVKRGHVSGFWCAVPMTADPDEVRGPGPSQSTGLESPDGVDGPDFRHRCVPCWSRDVEPSNGRSRPK